MSCTVQETHGQGKRLFGTFLKGKRGTLNRTKVWLMIEKETPNSQIIGRNPGERGGEASQENGGKQAGAMLLPGQRSRASGGKSCTRAKFSCDTTRARCRRGHGARLCREDDSPPDAP